jgi:PiT family inorganic phosphate transporter
MLASTIAGAPVSTAQVVASSIVGVGAGQRRWRRVRWAIVERIGLAWITTLPLSAVLGAIALLPWRGMA